LALPESINWLTVIKDVAMHFVADAAARARVLAGDSTVMWAGKSKYD